jgi:predicted amidohydrolase
MRLLLLLACLLLASAQQLLEGCAASAAPSSNAVLPSGNSYVAGAAQWVTLGNLSMAPAQVIQLNLDAFADLVARTVTQTPLDVLVLSEGALGMFNAEARNTHDAMLPYCAELGGVGAFNPCESYTQPPPTSSPQWQVWRASCLAREHKLLFAMDLCVTRPCDSTADPSCPATGRWQWNTQTLWDARGTLVLEYHKAHLFGESGVLDQAPASVEVYDGAMPTFGARFTTFICFDIMFASAVDAVSPRSRSSSSNGARGSSGGGGGGGAGDVLFPSWWIHATPSYNALMVQQGWSRVHGVNVVASNTANTARGRGGGIFARGEPLVTDFDSGSRNKGESKILVAKVMSVPPRSASAFEQQEQEPEQLTETATDAGGAATASPPVVVLTASQLPSVACQANVVTFSAANCTLFRMGQLRALAAAAGDHLATTAVTFQLPSASSGSTLRCSASLTLLATGSGTGTGADEEQYALVALDAVETYAYTPDALHEQVCALQHCATTGVRKSSSRRRRRRDARPASAGESTTSSGGPTVHCAGVFERYATRVGGFVLTATGIDQSAPAVPMLGLDDGQVGSTKLAVYSDSNETKVEESREPQHQRQSSTPVREVTWSSTAGFNESLFSAMLMAVVPNDASSTSTLPLPLPSSSASSSVSLPAAAAGAAGLPRSPRVAVT